MHRWGEGHRWLAPAVAAWAVGLGVAGVVTAVAHDGRSSITVSVRGAPDETGGPSTETSATSATSETTETSATRIDAVTEPIPASPTSAPGPTTTVTTAPMTTPMTRPLTTTTVRSTTTTTTTNPALASYFINNTASSEMVVTINDDLHLVPAGRILGPFTTAPRATGVAGLDVIEITLHADPPCGLGEPGTYFLPGRTYDIVVADNPNFCFGVTTAHAPAFSVTTRAA